MPKDIWTVSRLKTYQVCPYKENLRYRQGLALIRGKSSTAFGSAFHKALETRELHEALDILTPNFPKDQAEADEQAVAVVTLQALFEGYCERFPAFEHHKPEFEFELPMLTDRGRKSTKLKIAGKLDDLVKINNRWWVVEYKTASKLDASYFDRLYVDSQITMYMYAMERLGYNPAGVIYRVIRKPSLRKSQKETVGQFLKRLQDDIKSRPDFYFDERVLYRDKNDLSEFERMLYHETKQANEMARLGRCYRHSTACSMYGACDYLPLCMGEVGAKEALYEIREPNEELNTNKEVFE